MNSLGYSLDFSSDDLSELGVLETPSETINIISGGGLQFGKIITLYGESKSGKSTFCYQTASINMNKDPYTYLFIIDCESAIIPQRLYKAFGMNLSKIRKAKTPDGHLINTIEDACAYCIKLSDYLNKAAYHYKYTADQLESMTDKELSEVLESEETNSSKRYSYINSEWSPLPRDNMIDEIMIRGLARPAKDKMQKFIVIWDTIAASTIRESDKKLNEGASLSMRDNLTKPKIIKDWLPAVVARMGTLPISLMIINQVSTGFNSYGYSYETMSGGKALYHESDIVIHTKIESRTKSDDKYGEYTWSRFNIEKSRQSSTIDNISICISEPLGGVITNNENEIFELSKTLGIISGKNRYSIKDISGNFDVNNPQFLKKYQDNLSYWYPILKEKCVAHFRKKSLLVDSYYKELDNNYGNPETVDKKLFNFDKPNDNNNDNNENKDNPNVSEIIENISNDN